MLLWVSKRLMEAFFFSIIFFFRLFFVILQAKISYVEIFTNNYNGVYDNLGRICTRRNTYKV